MRTSSRFISDKKGEPAWMLEWRLDAYRRWIRWTSPPGRASIIPRSISRTSITTPRPRACRARRASTRSIPKLLETYAKLGIPLKEQEILAGVRAGRKERARREAVDQAGRHRCRVRFGLGRHHLQGRAGQGRRHLLLDLGSGPRASRAGEEISGLGRAAGRQFLCRAQFGGLFRRLLRLCAAQYALPDGAFDLFPHQREEHRPVRAHPHHRRQGRLRVLSRRLHRADARREPAPCRRGRADRAG